jgi:subtilase family serine protease
MPHNLRGSYLLGQVILAAALLFPVSLPGAQNRVVQALDTAESRAVAGNVHRLARPEFDQGRAAGEMMLHRMVLTFKPSAAQQADLDALLLEQQNPVSPYYHQWLTPEQFADRFAVSESDIAKVTDWLRAQGFTVDEVARSRTYVAFSGTAAQVRSAFGAEIHRFQVNGEAHYANVSDPSLPAPLADLVIGLRGLNDFRPRARAVVRRSPRPEFTSSISGDHFLAPDDFATIYDLKPLYNSGIDGTGQSIAVMGQTDLIMSDITTFRSVSGLPANTPTVKLVPGSADPGVVNNDLGEAELDVEWAGAIARNASVIYVNSKNVFDAMQYAVSVNIAPVISISYGDCEQNFSTSEINSLVAMGQQANAQGQTIVSPSGDSGAADCDYPTGPNSTVKTATQGLQVDIPAALPYVTGVGGTIFNEGSGTYWNSTNNANNGSALSYIPEVGWNDTALEIANGGSLAASGGGASKLFPKPFWQTGAGVPGDFHRDVPDISVAGSFDHDGYLICSNGSCVNGYRASDNSLFVVGGTSAGAPVFAGIVVLLNQKMSAPQGNVNPRLYALAASSPNAFHDITTGDNKVPCTVGSINCPSGTTSIGFSPGAGYDLVTGLGSVDAFNLITAWAQPDFQASISPASLSLTAGTTSNVGTSTLTIAALNGFTGTISFTCSVPSSLPATTCTVSPASLANAGSVTVTVTAPTTRTVNLRTPSVFPHFFPGPGATFAIAMGFAIAGKGQRGSRKRSLAILALLLFVGVGMMIGCGGGGSSPSVQTTSSPSSSTSVTGTGAVKVTATSGSLTRTVTTMVTVN